MNQIFKDIGKYLKDDEIQATSSNFDIPYSSLKAVLEVETLGRGFYEGTLIPVVRLENHLFGKETKYKYNNSHPQLSSTSFNGRFNLTGWKEFERFQKAYELDKIAAIRATSWGLGQVLGSNFKAAGLKNEQTFVYEMFLSEYHQFYAMVQFIVANNLDQHLRTEDWTSFARGYNGANFAQNQYDVKLKNAAARYKK